MNIKQKIVDIIKSEYERATNRYMKAHAERVGLEHAEIAWNFLNKDDGIGGISMNPYSSQQEWAAKREDEAEAEFKTMEKAYNVVVSTFLSESQDE